MKRLMVILLLATPALADSWSRYSNERFGATVDIPPGFASDAAAPENGDGLTFRNKGHTAELLVWGGNLAAWNFKEDAAQSAKGERSRGFTVTYEKVHNLSLKGEGKGWYALSGEKDGRVFYEKALASCKGQQAVHFRIEYPEKQKAEFDPIVTRLAASLHAVPGRDCPAG